jgi:hypothetical protein
MLKKEIRFRRAEADRPLMAATIRQRRIARSGARRRRNTSRRDKRHPIPDPRS